MKKIATYLYNIINSLKDKLVSPNLANIQTETLYPDLITHIRVLSLFKDKLYLSYLKWYISSKISGRCSSSDTKLEKCLFFTRLSSDEIRRLRILSEKLNYCLGDVDMYVPMNLEMNYHTSDINNREDFIQNMLRSPLEWNYKY